MVDFYDESCDEFDNEIENFKNMLRKEVKQEFLDEMERLRKENLELQEVKRNLEQIKFDHKKQLEEELAKLREDRRRVRKERFDELLKDVAIPITVYGIDTAPAHKPLCGHCDNRIIHFNSPSGKELTESCPECGQTFLKWVVVPMERYKICISEEDYCCWSIYELEFRTEDWQDRTWELKTNQLYKGEVNNISKELARKIFYYDRNVCETQEQAQEICDWLNRDLPADLELAINT